MRIGHSVIRCLGCGIELVGNFQCFALSSVYLLIDSSDIHVILCEMRTVKYEIAQRTSRIMCSTGNLRAVCINCMFALIFFQT